jgi:hypothetical protein
MPVLNDDPNSHDPLRPSCKSSKPSAEPKSTFSRSSLVSSGLSVGGLLNTAKSVGFLNAAKASKELKSHSHAPTSDGAMTEQKLEHNVAASRRPSNALAGLQQ